MYELANTTEDCKEALPDFYSSGGAFLLNLDRAQLGTLQTGEAVNHVALPKWARGSPRVFVETMRQALESDEVSANLHKWIDLIFGAAQTGPAGVRALNIHPTRTYPEEVRKHLKEAVTPEDQHVIVNEVINFGQTPMRVFDLEHPPKMPTSEIRGSASLSVTRMVLNHAKNVYIMKSSDVLMIPEHLRNHFSTALDAPAIKGFVTLKGGKVMTIQQYVVPVGQSHLCLCYTPHTGCFLYRSSLTKDSRGAGTVPFEAPFYSSISAMAVMDRESVVFIGTLTGVVYCFTNDMFRFTPMLGSILQGHTHQVAGFANSPSHSLLLSYTSSPTDHPILWRYMRRHAAFLTRLNLTDAFGGTPSVAICAAIDERDGSAIVATSSGIAVFASDGCVLGSGVCPREADGSLMPAVASVGVVPSTEWVDNGTLVYLTGHEHGVLCVWRATRRLTRDMCDDHCLACNMPEVASPEAASFAVPPPLITVTSAVEESFNSGLDSPSHPEVQPAAVGTEGTSATAIATSFPGSEPENADWVLVESAAQAPPPSTPPQRPSTHAPYPSKGFYDFLLVQRLDTGEDFTVTAITASPSGVIDLGYSNGSVRTAFPEPERIRKVVATLAHDEEVLQTPPSALQPQAPFVPPMPTSTSSSQMVPNASFPPATSSANPNDDERSAPLSMEGDPSAVDFLSFQESAVYASVDVEQLPPGLHDPETSTTPPPCQSGEAEKE